MTLTGRLANTQPNIQNLPGTMADKLSWAFERGLPVKTSADMAAQVDVDALAPPSLKIPSAHAFKWTFSGVEYARVGRCRVWLFYPIRRCLEVKVWWQDCDGDFIAWGVECEALNIKLQGSAGGGKSFDEDEHEAMQRIDAAVLSVYIEALERT
jgi:hypothetical protein